MMDAWKDVLNVENMLRLDAHACHDSCRSTLSQRTLNVKKTVLTELDLQRRHTPRCSVC